MITDHPFEGEKLENGEWACKTCGDPEDEHETVVYDFTPKTPPSVIFGRYYIELIGPNPEVSNAGFTGPIVATTYGLSDELLKEIEENINSLLHAPFKVRVTK